MTKTYVSGRLDLDVTAVDAIHHGAGVSGNTQLLRTQEIVEPDGSPARVPFISGNSLKHLIRDGAVRFALHAMQVPKGSLSKAVVDLLFSGGHLSKGGQSLDLEQARQVAELFPALSLLGYSAGNWMSGSRIQVNNLHMVCAENSFRTPARLKGLPHSEQRSAALRSEEFGTRHEASKQPHVDRMLSAEERKALEAAVSDAKQARDDGGSAVKRKGSSQMIYEFQTIKAGSKFFGAILYHDLSMHELAALKSGLSWSCKGRDGDDFFFGIGAKNSVGWGQVAIRFTGAWRKIDIPDLEESDALMPVPSMEGEHEDPDLNSYVGHLKDHRDDILALLEGMA